MDNYMCRRQTTITLSENLVCTLPHYNTWEEMRYKRIQVLDTRSRPTEHETTDFDLSALLLIFHFDRPDSLVPSCTYYLRQERVPQL